MIDVNARTEFNKAKLKKKMEIATFNSLRHAGGTIGKTARFSIRRRKKPSRPGSPPHTQTGMLKRVIRHEVSKRQNASHYWPRQRNRWTDWNLHEFGGTSTKRRKLKPHRFKVGEYGPIRVKQKGFNTKFARIQLKTTAQANRATRLIIEENERRGDNKPRHYPKRPFMKPALETNRSRLPAFWANSVK